MALDDLLREVLERVQAVLDEQARLRLLLDAVVTMAADLSLDGVLSRIVAIASRLADAQYAALGVLDTSPGRRLRTFVHHGMDRRHGHRDRRPAHGLGLLGLLIDEPAPLRLHDIAEHPASYGFPPHHPPMSSFLGVPVRIRDKVFGNLYLTEKAGGGDFTDQDEAIVVALAAAAGVAIENAQLYEEAARARALAARPRRRSRPSWRRPEGRRPAAGRRPGSRGLRGRRLLDRHRGRPESLELAVVSGVSTYLAAMRDAADASTPWRRSVVRTGEIVTVDDMA